MLRQAVASTSHHDFILGATAGGVRRHRALPLGARLVMDPWSNRLDLSRAPAVPLSWAREKLPLAITPIAPCIRYAGLPARSSSR